jgi:hypothetical protein
MQIRRIRRRAVSVQKRLGQGSPGDQRTRGKTGIVIQLAYWLEDSCTGPFADIGVSPKCFRDGHGREAHLLCNFFHSHKRVSLNLTPRSPVFPIFHHVVNFVILNPIQVLNGIRYALWAGMLLWCNGDRIAHLLHGAIAGKIS